MNLVAHLELRVEQLDARTIVTSTRLVTLDEGDEPTGAWVPFGVAQAEEDE